MEKKHPLYFTIHGHFYQPPRENPWTGVIENQPSARPFHDWNDRIASQCYSPNSASRILNSEGRIQDIVNNYDFMSFNMGPTLMGWIRTHTPDTYKRIQEADKRSAERLNGHGNAIAQVYNHIIMPLASEQDKRTQILWGIEDFKFHFGRMPEAMWLAETAINLPTVVELIKAVISMRQCKTDIEIAEIEKACAIGYRMHTHAMQMTRPGLTEKYVGGQVNGMAHSLGEHESFATIFTQHGEIMHGNPSYNILESGRLALCDAGAENKENYCSDNTRTFPVNGKFTQKQLEIYSIVEACHDYALEVAKPGVLWYDVHMNVCRLMTEKLKELGLMKGDTEAAVQAGAHAMFLPHGLGHMMGLDVHDMEGLGQNYVGFDEEIQPSTQFGTNALRCGKRLQEGFVMTDEPGIYFIPDLIDDWRSQGLHKDFINYELVETYKDFGGIRLEDDILITKDGCRFLGDNIIPYHPKDVEAFMAENL